MTRTWKKTRFSLSSGKTSRIAKIHTGGENADVLVFCSSVWPVHFCADSCSQAGHDRKGIQPNQRAYRETLRGTACRGLATGKRERMASLGKTNPLASRLLECTR